MTQPSWKTIANLGDVNPIDHGGLFVQVDETGEYEPELERLEPPSDDNEDGPYEVHRFTLTRMMEVIEDNVVYLVPASWSKDWPHAVGQYEEWFTSDLSSIASYVGSTMTQLRIDLCSEDPIKRADVYRSIADYHGWVNFDEYPLTLTKAEAEARIS